MAEQEGPSEIHLNRAQRRALGNERKSIKKWKSGRGSTTLKSVDTILEDDDIKVCQAELIAHQNMLLTTQISLQLCRLESDMGVSDETCRMIALGQIPGQTDYDAAAIQQLRVSERNLGKYFHNRRLLSNLGNILKHYRMYQPDDVELWRELIADRTIPLDALYSEYLNITKESIELIKLQIGDLKAKEQESQDRLHKGPQIQATESESSEDQDIEEPSSKQLPFVLSGWNLFWTERRWSTDPSHLLSIPTDNKDEAFESLSRIISSKVMIKPGSILKALEFHLQKDIIQRALATRLHYGPEEMREWVKIKRGRSRILLRVPEENIAIFFAGNRDEIYRRG